MDVSSASTQYVFVPVTGTLLGSSYDPTGDPVSLAFVSLGVTPGSGDWHTATWQTVNSSNLAVCLVGPANGGVMLDAGVWVVWVRVTATPEVPILQAGYLNVK